MIQLADKAIPREIGEISPPFQELLCILEEQEFQRVDTSDYQGRRTITDSINRNLERNKFRARPLPSHRRAHPAAALAREPQ